MTDTVALLRELVAIPSLNPYTSPCDDTHGESRMVAFLADWLQARGIDYELQDVLPERQNVIARLRGGDAPSVVFEAHMDTVETGGMEIAPFDPVVRDGKVYGRGSCDCKAAMAGMLVLLALPVCGTAG
ncbi:MAG: M20/M25/M40 family metallo-hydrolase, partial [Armatimonadota bacterium]